MGAGFLLGAFVTLLVVLGGWVMWLIGHGAGFDMTNEEREEFHRGGGL